MLAWATRFCAERWVSGGMLASCGYSVSRGRDDKMQRMMIAAVLAVTSATFAGTFVCEPQQTAKLMADDGAIEEFFGNSVALDAGVAVIGAYGDDDNGSQSGSAYIYEQQGDGTWQQLAKLTANDGVDGDQFGTSVAISGGVAIIGAYGDGSESGSAYVFEQQEDGTWVQSAKLTADDGDSQDYFGNSVALDAGVAVIGAYGTDVNGSQSGSAYVYEQQGDGMWQQISKLTPDDGATNDGFGKSVALDAGVAVIGADSDDDMGDSSGSVYVYEQQGNGTWLQIAKLTADDGAEGDNFGNSVALDAGVAVIGAEFDDDKGSQSGSVYVFERQGNGGWLQIAKVTADDGSMNDNFGYSVALDSGVAVIGAWLDSDIAEFSGSAYVCEQQLDGTWQQIAKLTPNDGTSNDYFGHSVATSGGVAVIGSPGNDDDNGFNSGSAYVYEQQVDGGWNPNALIDCNDNGICDYDEIAAAPINDTDENGILDECEVGACCIGTAVVCTISIELDCMQFGGQWQGLETTCEEVDCPTSCLGDLTGSGDVVIHDLLILLEHWGPCP